MLMLTRGLNRVCRNFNSAVFLLALLMAGSSAGYGAEYGAELSAAEIYTSNVNLAPNNLAESQWLSAVVPRVYVDLARPLYEFQLDYDLQAFFYSGQSELDKSYSNLWTHGSFDLVKDALVMNGTVRFTQVIIDPQRQQQDSNFFVTGNLSDAFAWEVGPRWRQNLFSNSRVDAFFNAGQIKYSKNDLQGTDTQRGEFRLETLDRDAARLSYRLLYNYDNVNFDVTEKTQFQRISFELGYSLASSVEVLVLAGSESNLKRNDGLLDEPYWEVGLRSEVRKNSFEAYVGHRFFGPTYRLRWARTTEKSSLWVDYRELQQTTELAAIDALSNDTAAGLNPIRDPTLTVGSGLDRPGSGNRFLRKRATLDYRRERYRGQNRFYAFWVDDKEISTLEVLPVGIQTISTSDNSYGGGLDVAWDVGPRTALSLFGNWSRRKFNTNGTGGSDNNDQYLVGSRLRYNVGKRLELCMSVGYRQQTGGSVEYDAVTAALRARWYFFGGRNYKAGSIDCSREY